LHTQANINWKYSNNKKEKMVLENNTISSMKNLAAKHNLSKDFFKQSWKNSFNKWKQFKKILNEHYNIIFKNISNIYNEWIKSCIYL